MHHGPSKNFQEWYRRRSSRRNFDRRRESKTLSEADIILILRNCLSNELVQYEISEQGIGVWLGEVNNKKFQFLTDTLIIPYMEIRRHSDTGISRKLQ
jgi:hypothetical protein